MTELFRWAKYLIYFLLFTQIYVYIDFSYLNKPLQGLVNETLFASLS